MRGRVLDNTSDYGTMSNQVDDQYLDDLIPNLNLSGDSFDNDNTVFNDITIQERRDRIESIINDIMSVPKLAEAGLSQRGAVSQEKIRKYLSHEDLSSRNVTSMSGGGIISKNGGKTSSRSFGLKRTSSINRNETKKEIKSRQEIQIKDSIIPRNRINSSLNKQEKNMQNGQGLKNSKPIRKPKIIATTNKLQNVTKKAEEKLDMTSVDSVPFVENNEEEISSHMVQLGQDTQEELAFHPPTLGDDTTQIQTNFSTSFEASTDMAPEFKNQFEVPSEDLALSGGTNSRNFLLENRNVASNRKGSGRNTANSEGQGGSAGSRHKAGKVPKYLKQRQQQWKDEAQAIIDSAPDPDCPPGHVRLPEPDRLQQLSDMKSSHSALLDDLNRLPVSKDTRRVIEKRREIEGLLAGLDEGIRIYSRSKVFIKKPD